MSHFATSHTLLWMEDIHIAICAQSIADTWIVDAWKYHARRSKVFCESAVVPARKTYTCLAFDGLSRQKRPPFRGKSQASNKRNISEWVRIRHACVSIRCGFTLCQTIHPFRRIRFQHKIIIIYTSSIRFTISSFSPTQLQIKIGMREINKWKNWNAKALRNGE